MHGLTLHGLCQDDMLTTSKGRGCSGTASQSSWSDGRPSTSKAQLRRMEGQPCKLTLKDKLQLGHVELSKKYDRHDMSATRPRVMTVGDFQHRVGRRSQLVLGSGGFIGGACAEFSTP